MWGSEGGCWPLLICLGYGPSSSPFVVLDVVFTTFVVELSTLLDLGVELNESKSEEVSVWGQHKTDTLRMDDHSYKTRHLCWPQG